MKKRLLGFLVLSCLLFLGVKKADAATVLTETTIPSTADPLYKGQTHIAVMAFSLTSTNAGTTTFTTINFTGSQKITNYFAGATIYLYTNTANNNDFTTATSIASGVITGTAGTALGFTFPTESIARNDFKYYWVVVDFTGTAGAIPGTFQLTMNTNGINSTAGTENYNDRTGPTYNMVAGSLIQDQNGGGLTANPLNTTQTNVVLSGVSLQSFGTSTVTGISYIASQRISNYFTGTAALYSSTSSTWLGTTDPSSTLLQSKPIPTNTTALAFTFPTQTINNGVTVYYYIVLSNYSPPTASVTFRFDVNTVTNTTTTLTTYNNKTGPTFNLNAPSISLDQTTGGLAANPLAVAQTNVALSGVALTATGTTSVTGISYTATKNFNPYFTGNVTLYTSTSSTFLGTTDPSSIALQTKAVPTGTTALAFTFTAQPISNGVTMYYYVVFDNFNVAATTTTFGLNVNLVTGTTTNYVNKTGTLYNLPAPSISLDQVTAGLAANPFPPVAQTNVALSGAALTATGTTSVTGISYTATKNFNPYFTGNVTLYTSTSSTFLGTTDPSSIALQTKAVPTGTTALAFTFTAQPISNGVTMYYYVVFDNYNVAAATTTFGLNVNLVTGTTTNYVNKTGTLYNLVAPSLAEATITAGLASTTLTTNQTSIAIFGMSLKATGNASFSALNFTTTTAPAANISAYFSSLSLYSSTSSTFLGTTDPSSTLLQTTTALGVNAYNFTGLTETINDGVTKYYYLVVNYNQPSVTGGTFRFNFTGTTGTAVSGTIATAQTYTITPPSLTEVQTTGGLVADPLNSVLVNVPINGIALTSSNGNSTLTSITYKATQAIGSYFTGNVTLYSSTSSTFLGTTDPTSTLIGTQGAPGVQNITFTFPTQTILNGVTTYYYMVMANYSPPQNTTTFEMDLVSITGSTNTLNDKTGTLYNLVAPSFTENQVTGGLAANPITGVQTKVAISGISLQATGPAHFTQLTYKASQIINAYFTGNVSLYSSTSSTWLGTTDPSSTLIGSQGAPNNVNLVFTVPNQNVATGTTLYYYVVMDNYTPPAATANFELDLVTVTAGSNTTYNNKLGTNYTLPAAVTLSIATTTGLAANPLNYSQSNIGVFGFTVTTTVTKAFTAFNLSASSTFASNGMSNVRIYRNTTNTFTNASANLVAISTPVSLTSVNPTFTFTTPETVNLGAPAYYFVVVDFVNPTVASTFQLSLKNAAVGATLYTNGATPLGTISSTNYNCGPATNNWVGGSSGNDWNVAANWSYNVVPLSTDNVQIGVTTYSPSTNNPIIAVTDPAITVASITFGSNNGNNITLTANNTLTVTNDITVQADDNSNGLQTFNFLGAPGGSNPNGIISVNLAGNSTITTQNIKVLATDDLWGNNFNAFSDYNETVNSSVNTLSVLGNVLLSSTYDWGTLFGLLSADNFYSATFNVSGGTATVNGYLGSTNTTHNAGHGNFATSYFTTTGGTLVLPNAAAMPTKPTVPLGLDIVGKNTIDFTAGGTVSYAGTSQTVYADANINSVTVGPSYNSISFSTPTTGIKTLTGGNLNVGGDFTNLLANDATSNVTLTGNQVNFNGTSAQKLYGGAGTGTVFKNVAFSGASSKTMTTGTFSVISTGTLAMNSTSTSCVLAAGGLLTLNSDISSTATVAAFSGSKITGNVNVQRYVSGGYRGYRLFSSPVNINGKTTQTGTTNEAFVDPTYLNSAMITAGPGTGFDINNFANPLIYLFDDTRASNANQFFSGKNVGIYSISGSTTYKVTPMKTDGTQITPAVQVPVGNSFLVFYTGNASLSTASPLSTVATATGTLNQGTINAWLFKPTVAGGSNQNLVTGALQGSSGMVLSLNQIGNPYPSTIQLGGTTGFYHDNSSSIKPVIYELDATVAPSGTYLAFNASGTTSATRATNYIVSGQGFWVQTISNTGGPYKLVFNETQKCAYFSNTSTDPNYGVLLMDKPNTPNHDVAAKSFAQNTAPPVTNVGKPLVGLHLQLSKDSITYTQTGIYFSSLWTDTFNDFDDAIDRDGTSPKLYLSSYSSDGARLAINQLADYTKGKRVQLYTNATTTGVYNLSIADLLNVDTVNYNVYLVDHKMNDSLDMVKYKSYAFNINTSDTTTYGANRFTLVIERHAVPPYQLISFSGEKVNNGIQLIWKTINEGTYTNFALQKLGGSNTYASIYTTPGSGLGLYSYVDLHPTTGNNTYRLQQTDIDGRVTYSAPVTIRYNGSMANGTLTIYPNPARSIINVSLNTNGPGLSNYMVDIYNISGTIIDHKTVNTNTWTQDVSNYKLGVYVIEIKTNTGYLVGESKFVKIN